jgi:hypothetical protein
VLVVLGAGAPLAPAQAPQLFLNNQSVSLRNPTLTQGEQLFVPLGEFARLLGAETTVSYESVTLRWGRNSTTLPTEQLVARGPLLYISLAQLAELLGVKMLKVGTAYYLFSTPARLLSVVVSASGVFFTLSARVPFELQKHNNSVTVRFFHTVSALKDSPLTLTAEPPVIVRAHMQLDSSQTAQATAVEAENFVVWVRVSTSSSEPRVLIRTEAQTQLSEDLLYVQARALTVDGPVSVHYLRVQNWKEQI